MLPTSSILQAMFLQTNSPRDSLTLGRRRHGTPLFAWCLQSRVSPRPRERGCCSAWSADACRRTNSDSTAPSSSRNHPLQLGRTHSPHTVSLQSAACDLLRATGDASLTFDLFAGRSPPQKTTHGKEGRIMKRSKGKDRDLVCSRVRASHSWARRFPFCRRSCKRCPGGLPGRCWGRGHIGRSQSPSGTPGELCVDASSW